jgi:hypothetical protein
VRRAAILALLALAGCRDQKAEVERFALDVVQAARSPDGIGPDLVDDVLVEKVRRLQLARRTTLDTMKREALVEALSGEVGPDKQYPVAERPKKQRERATRGLNATISGNCRAVHDTSGAEIHIKQLVAPIAGQPDEMLTAENEIDIALRGVDGAVLVCDTGKVGVVVHRGSDGKWKLVDMFDLQRQPIEINPNDPNMK